jgi:hypothetical protein
MPPPENDLNDRTLTNLHEFTKDQDPTTHETTERIEIAPR